MVTKANQKHKPVKSWEGQIEAIRDIPSGVGSALKNDAKQGLQDAFRQLAGLEQVMQQLSGELKAGESVDLSHAKKTPHHEEDYGFDNEKPVHVQPGYEYFHQFASLNETRTSREDTRQLQGRIDQILVELKNLTNSTQELSVEFEDVTMESMPVEAGTYHLNFFEWVFSVVQKARERIDEAQTWLTAFKSKKAQKNYWSMFKKHGTTFGLSNERVVATQTG